MLKAKVLAMCVCPALAVPPTVIAVHAPARHAVAHLLHRAAHRLDRAEPVPAIAVAPAAALPCAPSLAAAGGGGALPVVGGAAIGGTGDAGLILAATGEAAPPGFGFGGGDNGYSGGGGYGGGGFGSGGGSGVGGGGVGGGGGGGIGGGGGGVGSGGGGGGGVPLPPGGPSGAGPLPPTSPVTVSGAPEPAAWVFLVIGFGLVGALARRRVAAQA